MAITNNCVKSNETGAMKSPGQHELYKIVQTGGGDSFLAYVTVENKLGLHARPATRIVKTASKYDSDITLSYESGTANAKSILEVMTLEASPGSEIILNAYGSDSYKSLEDLIKLFKNKFYED